MDKLNILFSTWNNTNFISIEFPVTVPEIEDLYFNSEATDINWEMLAFIMEFDDVIVTAIKSLPREFRFVCTTLLVLVKVLCLIKSKLWMNW